MCFLNVHVIYWFDDSDSKKESFEFSYDGDMPQGSMLHSVYSRVWSSDQSPTWSFVATQLQAIELYLSDSGKCLTASAIQFTK